MRRVVKRAVNKTRTINAKLKLRFSVRNNFVFSMDFPKKTQQPKKTIIVEGWVIPKDQKPFDIRIVNGKNVIKPETQIIRNDVYRALGENYGDEAKYSGFRAEFEFEDGELSIEVRQSGAYRKIETKQIKYGLDKLPKYYYNKDLAWNYAEHQNLIECNRAYFYETASKKSIKLSPGDPRLMAIYLPQFHPIKENNMAWGEGFTEWTNVTAAVPRFTGHQQPILPSDLGFYDLRTPGKLKEQIDLAKQHGIFGFAFYYYWFSGKKIMDSPINEFIKNKDWDFGFSICWANENWTKRWDGRNDDVIIEQKYLETDPLDFIKDVEHILNDKRYLTHEGMPVLTVYRPEDLKDPQRYVKQWREYFRKKFKKELYLVSVLSFDDKNPSTYGFDAAMDFAPLSAFFKANKFKDQQFPYIKVEQKLLDANFEGVVADYRSIALNASLINGYDFKTLPCVTPSWDNDARKKGAGFIYTNSSPDIYEKWLDNTLNIYTKIEKSPIVYLNAWNEWAEGAMLEPSQHLGHATLNRTSKVLQKYIKSNTTVKTEKKLAVIIHLYYPELWNKIKTQLELISVPFDLFITVDQKDSNFDLTYTDKSVKVNKIVVPNRGRDVLPFLYCLRTVEELGYEYILKLHSKNTSHYSDGKKWFEDLLSGLIPSPDTVDLIVDTLSKNSTGVIGPIDHIVSLSRHMGSNNPQVHDILGRMYGDQKTTTILKNKSEYPFVGGTMFWARVDTFKALLDLHLLPADFESEHGQLDGTKAHAIERILGIQSRVNDKKMYTIEDATVRLLDEKKYTRKYKFAD